MVRRGDIRDDSTEIPFQSFLQEALVSSSGTRRDVHSLMLSIQHFLCRPWRRPPYKVLEEWFWRGCRGVLLVEPCKLPSVDSYHKRFLLTQKKDDLPPHPVVGLVLQVGDAEKFPRALGFEGLDPPIRVSLTNQDKVS